MTRQNKHYNKHNNKYKYNKSLPLDIKSNETAERVETEYNIQLPIIHKGYQLGLQIKTKTPPNCPIPDVFFEQALRGVHIGEDYFPINGY